MNSRHPVECQSEIVELSKAVHFCGFFYIAERYFATIMLRIFVIQLVGCRILNITWHRCLAGLGPAAGRWLPKAKLHFFGAGVLREASGEILA